VVHQHTRCSRGRTWNPHLAPHIPSSAHPSIAGSRTPLGTDRGGGPRGAAARTLPPGSTPRSSLTPSGASTASPYRAPPPAGSPQGALPPFILSRGHGAKEAGRGMIRNARTVCPMAPCRGPSSDLRIVGSSTGLTTGCVRFKWQSPLATTANTNQLTESNPPPPPRRTLDGLCLRGGVPPALRQPPGARPLLHPPSGPPPGGLRAFVLVGDCRPSAFSIFCKTPKAFWFRMFLTAWGCSWLFLNIPDL